MNVLLLADLHAKKRAYDLIKSRLGEFDLILILGDITDFGRPVEVERYVRNLMEVNDNILAIPGNCDPVESVNILEKLGVNLHEKIVEIDDIKFLGLGGSNLTPFSTPFEMDESEIEIRLESLLDKKENFILVTHAPPRDTKVDKTWSGLHVGSIAIRKYIERLSPSYNFCGHIHESRGKDEIKDTLIINPGPMVGFQFATINLRSGKIQFEKLR
ncbi:MAG: metallophosphoesterase [Candidatus Hydrothermarchaeota archaeon]